MKKFINAPDSFRSESLAGFAASHPDIVRLDAQGRFVTRRRPDRGKVALVSGGGFGHEPLHIGCVGRGMLDAACPGQVFTSPTPDQIAAAAAEVAGDAGTLFVVKSYSGDLMNFEMGQSLHRGRSRLVVVDDDAARRDDPDAEMHRGIAGTLIVEKLVGAAAEQGAPLDSLAALARDVASRTRSLGVALGSCTVPESGLPNFGLGAGEMEFGVGIHGEPGLRRSALLPARAMAEEMLSAVTGSLRADGWAPGPVLMLVNGLGATPAAELYLMAGLGRAVLESLGYTPLRCLVGSYVTALETAGCSFSLCMLDARLLALWDAPVLTAALRWGGG